MEVIVGILALVSLISGIMLLVFPRAVTKVSQVLDREYSTDQLRKLLEKEISTEKLADLLNRQIDINDKLIKFDRLIGAAALVMGIVLALVFFKVVCSPGV